MDDPPVDLVRVDSRVRSDRVVTPHKSLNLSAVYGRADLVVDTVNSSRGRVHRDRQVFAPGSRLGGAGRAGVAD